MLAGGTDLAGQIDRGIRAPSLARRPAGGGARRDRARRRGRPDRRHDDARGARPRRSRSRPTRLSRPPPASRRPRSFATRARSAATSASTRAAGTTVARSGRAGSAAATPATPRSATTASTTSRRATASPPIPPTSRRRSRPAAPPSSCARVTGEREVPLLELYRRPTEENRSLVALAVGELVVAVRLPAPPDASAYLRTGERQAFSFPLVSVAAARRGGELSLAAAGVANIPRALDPADPLAGLPGHPQSAWKRTVLATLVERATAASLGRERRRRACKPGVERVPTRGPSSPRGCPRCGRASARGARSAPTPDDPRSLRSRPRARLRPRAPAGSDRRRERRRRSPRERR